MNFSQADAIRTKEWWAGFCHGPASLIHLLDARDNHGRSGAAGRAPAAYADPFWAMHPRADAAEGNNSPL
jgi:hypothetical protein